MAISIKTVADKTYNLLKGYGYQIDTFNKVGEVVGDPADAIRFFVEDPNLLVTLNVPDEEIRLSISKNTEETDKLRKQLENLSKDYLMNLDFRVFGRTLKPSSESTDVAKETNMKETNELRKLAGLPLQEKDDIDSFKGSTKDGHKYRAKADDQDYSQYLKVFYGDGKYFRIYYDSRVTGGKAGGYDPKGIETNDPKAEKVFADLPDDFFKKYGSEGETGLEDIIDMIKKEDIKEEYEAGELPGVNVMQGESIKEATLGAVHGSLKTSYQPLDNVKLIVKHSKPVNEEIRGARSRNISKIFIQANEERFYFPSKNLQGARAMARHIYNGGVMHDSIGESIVQMCKDFGTLKEFIRYVNKKGLINEDNQEYVTLARQQMDNIRTSFKRVAGVKTYSKAVESITDESNIDIVTEVNLEDHFTETHFDDKVGNAHETLSKLVNRKNAFEQYIMNAIENENFANAKELIQEEPIEFENAHQRLGYQVGQLSGCVKDSKLANYLGGIGNKLSTGGQLDAMEYRAVKASLLSAQRPQQNVMATEMSLAESREYQLFIESFDIEI